MKFFTRFFLALSICDLFAARPFRGTYEVPLSGNPNAEKPADPENRFYPVKFKSNTNDVGSADVLELELPAQLVGSAFSFRMVKDNVSGEWSGENVNRGQCVKEGRYYSCSLEMLNVPVDIVKVEEELNADLTLSPQQRADKLTMAKIFLDEHLGVLQYRMRGRDK